MSVSPADKELRNESDRVFQDVGGLVWRTAI